MAHEGLAFGLDAILLCIDYACSRGVDSISSSSQGCQGLLQSVPSLQVIVAMPYYSIFSSGECGNAILQYCYGFNRLQHWLLAQGLLQSVLSLQVSVAMPYYSIVMVSIGSSSGSSLAQGLLQSVLSLQVSVAIPYYSIVMVSIGVSFGF